MTRKILSSILKPNLPSKQQNKKKYSYDQNSEQSCSNHQMKENKNPQRRKRIMNKSYNKENELFFRHKSINSVNFVQNNLQSKNNYESVQNENCPDKINMQSKLHVFKLDKKSHSLCSESLKNILSKKISLKTDDESQVKPLQNITSLNISIKTPITNPNKDDIFSFKESNILPSMKPRKQHQSKLSISSMHDSKYFIPFSRIFSKREMNQNDSMANISQITNLDKFYMSNRSKIINTSIEPCINPSSHAIQPVSTPRTPNKDPLKSNFIHLPIKNQCTTTT